MSLMMIFVDDGPTVYCNIMRRECERRREDQRRDV